MTAPRGVTELDVPHRSPYCRIRNTGGALYISIGDDALHLDPVSEYIFRAVDGHRSTAELSAALAREFDIPLRLATDDLTEVLSQWHGIGIVRLADEQPHRSGGQ